MTRNQPFHESQLLDFHTHRVRHEDDTGVQEIVSLHLGEQHQKAHEYFTIGMHPWWTDQPASNVQQEELGRLLRHPNCLALGEIGLDKLKGPDMSVQLQVFRSLLAIALEFHQPVIIHCVRAFDQLLRVKKAFPEMEKWCIHGYGRHVTLARQLIDQGFYLSLMPAPGLKYQQWFDALPHDRLFLETDSMPDVSIQEVYQRVCEASGMNMAYLKRQMNHNAKEFFNL